MGDGGLIGGVLFIVIVVNREGKFWKADGQAVVELPTDVSNGGRKMWVLEFDVKYVVDVVAEPHSRHSSHLQ